MTTIFSPGGTLNMGVSNPVSTNQLTAYSANTDITIYGNGTGLVHTATSDQTKSIKFSPGGTSGTQITIVGAQTANRNYTLADAGADDTFAFLAAIQTMSNKAFSSDITYTSGADRHLGVQQATGSGNALYVYSGSAATAATDTAGGDVAISGGQSTGMGRSRLRLQGYSTATATGTANNTQVDRVIINSAKAITNNTVTTLATLTVASNSATGGQVFYTITATDGGDYQSHTGSINYAIVNKAAAVTYQIVEITPAVVLTAGTLAVTWSVLTGSPTSSLQINIDSSLAVVSGYPRITYTFQNNGDQVVL